MLRESMTPQADAAFTIVALVLLFIAVFTAGVDKGQAQTCDQVRHVLSRTQNTAAQETLRAVDLCQE